MKGKNLGLILILLFALGAAAWVAYTLLTPKQSVASMSATIYYTDGSTREVTSEKAAFSLLPQNVEDNTGKYISKVDWSVKVTPSFYGVPISTSVTGTVDTQYDLVTKATTNVSYTTLLVQDTAKTLCSGSITGVQMEAATPAAGVHGLKIIANLKLTATFSDGKVDNIGKTGSAFFSMEYETVPSGVAGLSVTVVGTPVL